MIFVVKVVIIDYKIGNVGSLSRSFMKVGAEVEISADPAVIHEADGLLLPGDGAFEAGITNLQPLVNTIFDETNAGKPLLGICIGYQFSFPQAKRGIFYGFGCFQSTVIHFPPIGLESAPYGMEFLTN